MTVDETVKSHRASFGLVRGCASLIVLLLALTWTVQKGNVEDPSLWHSSQLVHEGVILEMKDNAPTQRTKSFKPCQVLDEWKRYHSVEALRAYSSTKPADRKFILGKYSCPDMTGNLVHEFTISLLLAIITNRTLLYDFDDSHLKNKNAKADCDAFLQPAAWVPSYTEFKEIWQLPEPKLVQPKNFLRYPPIQKDRFCPYSESEANRNHRLVHPYHVWDMTEHSLLWRAGDLILTQAKTYIRTSQLYGFEDDERAPGIVKDLYANGYSFLMGMLRKESIEFTQQLVDSVQSYMLEGNALREQVTIAVHSRHIRTRLDGSDVRSEVNCLDQLLTKLRRPQQPCTIFIMADRQLTLDKLEDVVKARNCSAVIVEKKTMEVRQEESKSLQDIEAEHGPFRGGGFFRDWIVVAQATRGFIHYRDRSSSAIVFEQSVYDGMMKSIIDKPPLRCEMDWKDPNGRGRLMQDNQ